MIKKFNTPVLKILTTSMLFASVANAFEAQNLAILRVGDGVLPLSSAGNAVFIDERASDGSLLSSVALPTASATLAARPASTSADSVRALLLNGTSIPEGQLTRSQDGRYLIIAGYSRDLGSATSVLSSTSGIDVPRVVARVDSAGVIDSSTALTDAYSNLGFRGAASADGSAFWLIGSGQGVRYAALGASTSNLVSDTGTNLRHLKVVDDSVVIATAQASAPFRLGAIAGLPQTGPQVIQSLGGVPIDNTGLFANAFTFLDVNAAEAGSDLLYVTEDLPNSGTSGLAKFSRVAGNWVLNGRIPLAPTRAIAARIGANASAIEIFVIVTGDTCTSWSTNLPTRLCRIVDQAGYNSAPVFAPVTELLPNTPNSALRGLAFTPVAQDALYKNGFEEN